MGRIKILPQQLSDTALKGVIDEFISREGTDYGHKDYSLEAKRRAVMVQIESGSAIVCFDPDSETTSIVDSALFKKDF